MLLDSVLENKGIVAEGTEIDMSDALMECAVSIEEAYGDMMVEQAKCEFKQYVNEGKIDALNEGILDSVKNFFKKLWNFIKKYYNKLKTWVTGLNKNAYQYFQTNQEKIKNGIKSITRFYGYTGLKNFDNINSYGNKIGSAATAALKTADMFIKDFKKLDHSNNKGAGEEASNKSKEYLGDLKKVIVGDSASTEESFTAMIKDDIRGGSREVELSYKTIDEIKAVVGSEAAVSSIALGLKALEKSTKDLENKAYGLAHQENDKDRSGSAVHYLTQAAKLISSAASATSSMIPAVVKQADRFQHAAVAGKSDDERKNEDTEMTADEAKAYLESIGIA